MLMAQHIIKEDMRDDMGKGRDFVTKRRDRTDTAYKAEGYGSIYL